MSDINRVTKVILLFYLLSLGCNSDEAKLPEGIISKDKMIEIIADIQLLEGAHRTLNMRGNEQQAMRDTSYQIVFNKHNVDHVLFDSSLRSYALFPELLEEMMGDVEIKLNTSP